MRNARRPPPPRAPGLFETHTPRAAPPTSTLPRFQDLEFHHHNLNIIKAFESTLGLRPRAVKRRQTPPCRALTTHRHPSASRRSLPLPLRIQVGAVAREGQKARRPPRGGRVSVDTKARRSPARPLSHLADWPRLLRPSLEAALGVIYRALGWPCWREEGPSPAGGRRGRVLLARWKPHPTARWFSTQVVCDLSKMSRGWEVSGLWHLNKKVTPPRREYLRAHSEFEEALRHGHTMAAAAAALLLATLLSGAPEMAAAAARLLPTPRRSHGATQLPLTTAWGLPRGRPNQRPSRQAARMSHLATRRCSAASRR